MANDWTQGTIPSGEIAQHFTIYQNGVPMEVFTFPQGLIDMFAAQRDRGEVPGFSFAPSVVWHCSECELFGENIETPDHGRKGGESRSFGVADIRNELRQIRASLSFLLSHEKMFTADELEDLSEAHLRVERTLLHGFPDEKESGRKGGLASSPSAEPYVGIDYSMGMSNVDRATGIRYGCISQHSLCQESLNESMEADYGDPHCPECGGGVFESAAVKHPNLWTRRMDKADTRGCFDYACLACRQGFDSEECFPEDPIGHSFSADGYELIDCLDSDVMVLNSPFYTHGAFCSPCVPGGVSLDSPIEGGVKAYALGHEWFEGNRAPYPVFRVSDDSVVAAEEDLLHPDPLNNPGNIGGFHRAGEIHGHDV